MCDILQIKKNPILRQLFRITIKNWLWINMAVMYENVCGNSVGIVQFFFKSIVNVKIPPKTRLYHPKTFRFGTLYRKISLDQV
jgi:hypothetical protein